MALQQLKSVVAPSGTLVRHAEGPATAKSLACAPPADIFVGVVKRLARQEVKRPSMRTTLTEGPTFSSVIGAGRRPVGLRWWMR